MDHNAPWLAAPSPLRVHACFVCVCVCVCVRAMLPHNHTGTPDHAKADLEMKNDPPLAVLCCISSQL